MALNPESLAQDILEFLKTQNMEITDENEADLRALWQGISQAIIQHIVMNAQVQTTVQVTTPQGPGIGTGSGTII